MEATHQDMLGSHQQDQYFRARQSPHCELLELRHRLAVCSDRSPFLDLLGEYQARVVRLEVRDERLVHRGGLVVENWSFVYPIHFYDVTT